jgi:hypothetical protein
MKNRRLYKNTTQHLTQQDQDNSKNSARELPTSIEKPGTVAPDIGQNAKT